MIITLNVTVAKSYWDETTVRKEVQKEVELHTENLVPSDLPWDAICAGLIQSALKEYAENKNKQEETNE